MTNDTAEKLDEETSSLLGSASFTSSAPPAISRKSKWAELLDDVEARGLDPDNDDDRARLGPYVDASQAYSLASRVTRGKIRGAEPAGKFGATSRTITDPENAEGLGVGTHVWIWLNHSD